MNDTAPAITDLVRRRLMARLGTERIVMGNKMFDVARVMILASFPDGLTDIEIKAHLCEQLYGNEVNVQGFVEHLRRRERQ